LINKNLTKLNNHITTFFLFHSSTYFPLPLPSLSPPHSFPYKSLFHTHSTSLSFFFLSPSLSSLSLSLFYSLYTTLSPSLLTVDWQAAAVVPPAYLLSPQLPLSPPSLSSSLSLTLYLSPSLRHWLNLTVSQIRPSLDSSPATAPLQPPP